RHRARGPPLSGDREAPRDAQARHRPDSPRGPGARDGGHRRLQEAPQAGRGEERGARGVRAEDGPRRGDPRHGHREDAPPPGKARARPLSPIERRWAPQPPKSTERMIAPVPISIAESVSATTPDAPESGFSSSARAVPIAWDSVPSASPRATGA